MNLVYGFVICLIVSFVQADPAQALNVPVVPLGSILSAAYPLSSRSPYVLSWLHGLISAEEMMHPELLKKLVLYNFCESTFFRCICTCSKLEMHAAFITIALR